MKRLAALLSVLILAQIIFSTPVQAGFFAEREARIQYNKKFDKTYDEVKSLIQNQVVLCNKYDFEGLKELYADNYVNSDGINKDAYFKFVKDTWKAYPNIQYKITINDIQFNDKYAKVEVFETAQAQLGEDELIMAKRGYLESGVSSVYQLENIGGKWFITAENIIEEKTTMKYGEARYIDMYMLTPMSAGAGKYYSADLHVNVPENFFVVASIGNTKITYPQDPVNEAFRKLSVDNNLERVFLANKDNVNEYATASVGIARIEKAGTFDARIYMEGLAFIMSRVNVVPENKFIKLEEVEEKNAKTR